MITSSSFELLDIAEGLNYLHMNNLSFGTFAVVGIFFGSFRALVINSLSLARHYHRSRGSCSSDVFDASLGRSQRLPHSFSIVDSTGDYSGILPAPLSERILFRCDRDRGSSYYLAAYSIGGREMDNLSSA